MVTNSLQRFIVGHVVTLNKLRADHHNFAVSLARKKIVRVLLRCHQDASYLLVQRSNNDENRRTLVNNLDSKKFHDLQLDNHLTDMNLKVLKLIL